MSGDRSPFPELKHDDMVTCGLAGWRSLFSAWNSNSENVCNENVCYDNSNTWFTTYYYCINSTFTTHILQCHIYFVIIPILIPHIPGLYGLRNGSLTLFFLTKKNIFVFIEKFPTVSPRGSNRGKVLYLLSLDHSTNHMIMYVCMYICICMMYVWYGYLYCNHSVHVLYEFFKF